MIIKESRLRRIIRQVLLEEEEKDKDFEGDQGLKPNVKRLMQPNISSMKRQEFIGDIDDEDDPMEQAQALAIHAYDYADGDKGRVKDLIRKVLQQLDPLEKAMEKEVAKKSKEP